MTSTKNIPILMYHHVTANGGSLAVSAGHFESQIRGLAKAGYHALSTTDLANFYSGAAIPEKSVLITFDDGYLDNWVYAHPVLQRYGFCAVLFAITGLIGNGPVRPHAGQSGRLPNCPDHHEAKRVMFGPEPDRVMLRWSEIEAMLAAGSFEIHSHTHTHKRWDKLCQSTAEKTELLTADLKQSIDTLRSRLGESSQHLCWPQGYFDDDYLEVARRTGFHYLYTTDARGQNTATSNPRHLYRFAVRNRPASWLLRRVWLATHPRWGPAYNAYKKRSDKKKASRHRVS